MRLAAMDTSAAAFRKLDHDNDGRISALEAADNPKVCRGVHHGRQGQRWVFEQGRIRGDESCLAECHERDRRFEPDAEIALQYPAEIVRQIPER